MSVLEAIGPKVHSARTSPWAAIRARQGYRSLALLLPAALITVGVGCVHLAVAPDHFEEFPLYGALFLLTGVAQLGLAAAILLAPSGRLFVAATLGTLGLIATWFGSRITGLPIAPVPWWPEVPGMLDMLTTIAEIILVGLYLGSIRAPRRRPWLWLPIRVGIAGVATTPAAAVAIGLIGLGAGAMLNPMPRAYSAAPPKSSTVSIASLVAAPGSQPVRAFTLTAAESRFEGSLAYAYNGTIPGPELRVNQGDRVRVTLVNHLAQSTSIHWHGINVPNSMDGVAGMTQNGIDPGRTFTYEFIASEPGTYWYHSHQATMEQLTRGLYGSIVVLPKGGVKEDHDYSVLFHSTTNGGELGIGQELRINGVASAHLAAAAGETVRLRLTNASIPSPFGGEPIAPVLFGAPYRVVALDGHDLNVPQEIGPERIRLGMGQRADLVFRMPASGRVVLSQKGVQLNVGDGPAPTQAAEQPPVFDLTTYGRPAADAVALAASYDVVRTLLLNGGPGFRNGTFDFEDTFDGAASPMVPPIHVREGQLVKLHIVNQTKIKFHPIHIHGHTFTVLARNGVPITGSPIHLDAVLVPPGETWDVAFRADNPGVWMLHCHVLGHAYAGMSMAIVYDGYSTPYTMGSESGNAPE